MITTITDEVPLYMTYHHIDIVMDYLDEGLTEDDVAPANIGREAIDHVRTIRDLSEWKRRRRANHPPVDGCLTVNVRALRYQCAGT